MHTHHITNCRVCIVYHHLWPKKKLQAFEEGIGQHSPYCCLHGYQDSSRVFVCPTVSPLWRQHPGSVVFFCSGATRWYTMGTLPSLCGHVSLFTQLLIQCLCIGRQWEEWLELARHLAYTSNNTQRKILFLSFPKVFILDWEVLFPWGFMDSRILDIDSATCRCDVC